MIKLTFEGLNLEELRAEIKKFFQSSEPMVREHTVPAAAVPAPVLKAAVSKPKPDPQENAVAAALAIKADQKANAAERMAKARAAKMAKASAPEYTDLSVVPKGAKAPAPKPEPKPSIIPPEVMQTEKALQPEKFEDMVLEPDPQDEPEVLDPVQLTAIRVKTTEDLQAAYSNGKHKAVLALLAKYGNGAKSFRELQIQDFVPIRKAIDEGALA